MTEAQQSASTQILDRVSTQISTVAAIANDVEEFERTKFTHLATNLANRRGFNKKLAELYGGERYPDGMSLLLCNLLALEPFDAKELIKVKEAVLERLGFVVARTVQTTDFAAWLDRPQIGILVGTTAEGKSKRSRTISERAALRRSIAGRQKCPLSLDASAAAPVMMPARHRNWSGKRKRPCRSPQRPQAIGSCSFQAALLLAPAKTGCSTAIDVKRSRRLRSIRQVLRRLIFALDDWPTRRSACIFHGV